MLGRLVAIVVGLIAAAAMLALRRWIGGNSPPRRYRTTMAQALPEDPLPEAMPELPTSERSDEYSHFQ